MKEKDEKRTRKQILEREREEGREKHHIQKMFFIEFLKTI